MDGVLPPLLTSSRQARLVEGIQKLGVSPGTGDLNLAVHTTVYLFVHPVLNAVELGVTIRIPESWGRPRPGEIGFFEINFRPKVCERNSFCYALG